MGFIDRVLGREVLVDSYVPEERASFIPSRANFVVNEVAALSLIPVSRCISVLETSAMQIPVEVYRGIDKIDSPSWLQTPDIEKGVSQAEFIGETVVSMALYGNAYWKLTRGTRGLSNIEVVPANLVSIEQDVYGNNTYFINGVRQATDSFKHLKLWSIPGDIYGQGPLQRHKSIILSAKDLQDYADNWFKTSAVPTGILTTSEFLSADIALSNKDAFVKSQQDRSVAVLSSGLNYSPVALNPEEAQFLENQKYIARQIATMFGVPSMYLGMSVEGSGMTYTNGNEDRQKLFEDGLQQYTTRISQALSDLLPRGQEAEFNLTNFLRPNTLNRYQSYQVGLNAGFLTVDEVRELEGLPAMKMQDVATPVDPQPVDNNQNVDVPVA
ncbi:COG4695 Phage-related protein [uncultured Caudovirales phage]|uniref:COG4695 Phage-related protein n=1 Tax=uncultured Caudovirales phage TaxID=2100421 RepID=A0A6J5N9H3_9CAUD|nr:COG4695 Phage-related protein [uncultured Caudovirales phage]